VDSGVKCKNRINRDLKIDGDRERRLLGGPPHETIPGPVVWVVPQTMRADRDGKRRELIETDGERPFRFGVIGESIRSREQLIATARRSEKLGYSTLLLRDHFVPEPFGDQLAPLVALTAAAEATRELRVGSLVVDNDYRHPVMLAKEAATLDLLSGGRFELGIGAGWLRDEYARGGMAFDDPGVRVGRLNESLTILKGLFAGSALTFSGTHYSVTDLEIFPEPAQRPRPPILVGAGSRRMLGIAGREADIVGILPKALPSGSISDALSERSPQTMERRIEWVREAAGERFPDIELSTMISVTIADDHRQAAERFAVERGWGREAADLVLEMPSKFVGSRVRVGDEMHARRDRLGLSYYVVSDRELEAVGPLVEDLSGR
jgi:probable F420-dependent oxidoreductase